MESIKLKDISYITGYSISTVSKALNDKSDINQFTKSKIKNIAELCNYVPNNYAIALRKRKTKTIGVIVPNISDLICCVFLSELEPLFFNEGYKLLVLQSLQSLKKESECINLLNGGRVDGMIIIAINGNVCSELLKSVPQNVQLDYNKMEVNSCRNKEWINSIYLKLIRQIN